MPAVLQDAGDGVGQKLDIHFTTPRVVQEFIQDSTFCTGYFGPFGCAKTTGGIFKSWGYGRAWPGARIATVRDTWPNLRDTTLKTFFEWFPDHIAGKWEAQKKTFWLDNDDGRVSGSRVQVSAPRTEVLFRAMYDRADMENVLSLDLGACHVDEPQGGLAYRGEHGVVHEPGINQELFYGLQARLGRQTGYPGMMWCTGNPPPPTHWITKEFQYQPGKSGNAPPQNGREDYCLYLGDQDTNRHNLAPGYYERLTRLFGVGTPMALRFIRGLWIDFAQAKPFHLDWIQYAGRDGNPSIPLPETMAVEIGFDPAISKKDLASKSAIVVAGQVKVKKQEDATLGRMFILEAVAGHWSVWEQVNKLLHFCRKYSVRTVRIEKVAYQAAIGEILERAAREAGVMVHVQLVTPDADKLTRASAWSPLVEGGSVLFGPGLEELIDCLVSVPDDQTKWDLVDAAGYVIRGFRKIEAEHERITAEQAAQNIAAAYATVSGQSGYQQKGMFVMPKPGAPLAGRPRGPQRKADVSKRATGYAVRQPAIGRHGRG